CSAPTISRSESMSVMETELVMSESYSIRREVSKRDFGVLMQHGIGIWLPDQFRIQIQVIIEPAVCFCVINRARHQYVSRVMVAFGFDEAAVEFCEIRITFVQRLGQHLKFFAAPAFDQGA